MTADRRGSSILAAVTVSAMIGPGISYGPLYLFHIVLVIALLAILLMPRKELMRRLVMDRWTLGCASIFLCFLLLAAFRSPSWREAATTLVGMGSGMLLMFVLMVFTEDRGRFRLVLLCAGSVLVAELALSLLEAAELVRWPISRFSKVIGYFGRTNDLAALTTTPRNAAFISSSPTGFHWNPNDLCTGLLILFPFALILRRRWVGAVISLAILVVILAAGARIAYVVMAMLAVLALGFRQARVVGAIVLAALLVVSTNGFSSRYSTNVKLQEMQVFSRVLVGADLDLDQLGINAGEEEGSSAMRRHVYRSGVQAVKSCWGMGMGLGATAIWLGAHPIPGGRVLTDMHNWWLELAVDLGLPALLVLLVWLAGLAFRLWRDLRKDRDPSEANVRIALLLALLGLFPAALGPSSMGYALPMYVLFAVAAIAARRPTVTTPLPVAGTA